ncbi:hypothetical protein MJO29_011348 [Puccinia striiformis f. sp. tritici]|nr:hypothetical protein MJO29_011348 [Puccinia striiformis f. sp. tritici]KAI9614795.1 hypothetical protein H4Q26_009189 [Puccinia striiformis f. sp. tritici PST-130]
MHVSQMRHRPRCECGIGWAVAGAQREPVTPRASLELHLSLRKVLSRAYDVKLANNDLLNHQPWPDHTSLVVFPSLEPDEHDGLAGETRRTLRQWVGRGGRYLGIGTGARFAGTHQLGLIDLTWNLLPSHFSPSSASTSPQSCRGVDFPQQQHTGQSCTSASKLSIGIEKPAFGTSLRIQDEDQPKVWADYYQDTDHQDHIAGVWKAYQSGYVALLGFDLNCDPEKLVEILGLIGLQGLSDPLSETDSSEKSSSTLYLVVSPFSPASAQETYRNIMGRCTNAPEHILEDVQDKFIIMSTGGGDELPQSQAATDNDDQALQLFIWPSHTNYSESAPTPTSFDWNRCFSSLVEPLQSNIGTTILYAETMTSTQTLIEKNTKLADSLPNGTVTIAARQTNGRGRGANNWISSQGSIQFSLLIKTTNGLGSSLVFVQYLSGLAVIEWIDKRFKGKILVKLKWPNDIYGSASTTTTTTTTNIDGKSYRDSFKKMGGILVNCSFGGIGGTQCKLVIGCGLNNHSSPQSKTTISLSELIHAARESKNTPDDHDLIHPSNEEIIAGIVESFGQMWSRFEGLGFQPFLALYLSHWLHSDQIIKYEKTGEDLKIIGIDPSYGLLRTKLIKKSSEDGVNYNRYNSTNQEVIIDLQPDSNSFDMFAGLIKTKS